MRITIQSGSSLRGVAMIIVMVVVLVLGVLAGGFAYTMKVEMTLARNAQQEPNLEWLGRSGVEFARYVLAEQAALADEPYDALNQVWAGGPGSITNEALAGISLENNRLGEGQFSVEIEDLERKFNINLANEVILRQAVILIGADVGRSATIVDSVLDWRDPDDDPRVSGAEEDHYTRLEPPYHAKNGPIDHVSELLLVEGITPAIYWGPRQISDGNPSGPAEGEIFGEEMDFYPYGLVDLFTHVSIGRINVNTAPSEVLQLVPGIGESLAQRIISTRAGPDRIEGTEDDMPYRTVDELPLPGIGGERREQLDALFTVRSVHFEVTVTATTDHLEKRYVALLRRSSPTDIEILYFHEE